MDVDVPVENSINFELDNFFCRYGKAEWLKMNITVSRVALSQANRLTPRSSYIFLL